MSFKASIVVAMKMLNTLMLLLIFMATVIPVAVADGGKKKVTIYSYHGEPPYYLDDNNWGMTHSWVNAFNQQHDSIELVLIELTRPELNQLILQGQSYLIIWANPLWFHKIAPNILSSDTIFTDADVWVSRYEDRVIYKEPDDLTGLNVGLRYGYYYHGVTELGDAGEFLALYNNSDLKNYTALRRGQIDTFVISRSILLYWFTHRINRSKLYISESVHDAYTRHVLASNDYQHLLPEINHFIEQLKKDKSWQKKLQFWGLNSLFKPFKVDLDKELELKELETVRD